jgi:chromosome partitioning protein
MSIPIGWVPGAGLDCKATHLISGDLNAADIAGVKEHAAGQPKLKIITAYYDLAQAENRVMIEWLIGDQPDVRMRLAELLHSSAVINAFSLIIIDCPPRLTTGAIQALAAATHLLIPTILDETSTDAVVSFVRQVETFREGKLCPHIKHVGVVGTMTSDREDTTGVRERLRKQLNDIGMVTDLLPVETFIPRSTRFRAAGNKGIGYVVMGNGPTTVKVKAAVNKLAELVKNKMGLT